MKLAVIDGKSVFYRGYYAMGALSTSDGTPTGGVYGFAVIAMELIERLQPDKVVVAWDKAKTSTAKRTAIYPEYKAGRKKPDADFFAQIPLLRELVDALGWGFVEVDNYEADDIIGTFAAQIHEPDEMVIISSDLDMLQVVSPSVRIYRLLKGFSKLEEIDVAAVEKKYGILKSQFLDLKALKGDASDNIPGVPGIGEKGAVKLLNEFGSVEGIYEHLDEIQGSIRKKLEAGKESALMSYTLAKIMTDAPVSVTEVPDLQVDGEKVVAVLKRLEFNTLIRKYARLLKVEEIDREVKRVAAEVKIDGDLLISEDVKRYFHQHPGEVSRKFWDLSQGRFLLNPLARREEGQAVLEFPEENLAEYQRQREEYEKLPRLYEVLTGLDFPMIPVLYKMEERGMKIDQKYFAELRDEFTEVVRGIEQEIYTMAGVEFNMKSPYQLSDVLFGKLGLPTKGIKKGSRGYSTGAKELKKLEGLHPIIPKLLEYREASKLLSTYILPLPDLADEEGRIHTTFTQNVTATGRLSSVGPNLQNIPVRTEEGKRIRTGFVAEDGKVLISADYSQFELRLAAVMSGDKALIDDFNSGVDIHTKTASDVFGVGMEEVSKKQRRAAKTINFGVLYGMSAKGLAAATGMNLTEAAAFIKGYFEVRKPIREYLDKILTQAREEGFVETFYGRRRPTPDVKSSNFIVRAGAERAAQNMPIQGTEADLMKRAMIALDSRLPAGAEMICQVHDSVIVECEERLAAEVSGILQETMEGVAPELPIKLAVEVTVGKNWGEL